MPTSCYLLEFSVGPGGARHAHIHAYGDFDRLRASFERHDDVDDYLVIWYGATLVLWVVQEGVVVDDIDLHPYLRTGDAQYDRTLARLLDLRFSGDDGTDTERLDAMCVQHELADTWGRFVDSLVDKLTELHHGVAIRALPLFTTLFALADRITAGDEQATVELRALVESVEPDEASARLDESTLTLDWAAIAADLPPLRAPVLTTGEVTAELTADSPDAEDGYLAKCNEDLHVGLNDLEGGEDEYPDQDRP